MKNKDYSTKAMVEASLMAVIISIMMIIVGYLPFLAFIGTMILPIPVAILYIRHNSKITMAAIVLSIILASLVYNPIVAIGSAITCGIVGIALGYCVKKNKSPSTTLLFLAIGCAISIVLTIAFTLLFIEKTSFMNFITNQLNFMKASMTASFTQLKAIYTQTGITPKQLKIINDNLEIINQMDVMLILIVIPTFIYIYSFISAYLNYIVSRSILKKLNYKMQEVLPFSRSYVSNIVGAVLIGTVCIGIILSTKKITGGNYILNASQLLTQYIFIINGLAAVTYFLRVKRKLSKPIVLLFIGLTTISSLGKIYFLIGLMEMAFDFRRLDPYRINRK